MSTIIIQGSGLLGDSLCADVAVIAYSQKLKQQGEKLYLIHVRRDVLDLAPNQDNIVALGELSHIGIVPDLDNAKFITMSASKAWQAGIHDVHMAQAHMRYLGLPLTEPRHDLQFNHIETPQYDFVIAPYSRSNHMNNKLWPFDRWQKVIDHVTSKGATVGVLGAGPDDPQVFTGVEYIFNKPLGEVCSYITNAKRAALSIDNGISHMISFLRKPHFLLAPQCLPPNWITNNNSNAHIIRNEPLNVTVPNVIGMINKYWM